ncbi:MAG: VWA domain-containing protein [Victivallaceae bacterium]|nr:VWA domain-containing protein [Victivallaceae bacterium]
MIFLYPWVMVLIIPWLFLLWYLLKRQRQPAVRVPSLEAFVKSGATGYGGALNFPMLLSALAVLLLILAAARPCRGTERTVIKGQGIDIMLAIDLSGSMQAIDIPSHISTYNQLEKGLKTGELLNRLEVAKRELSKFVERRPYDRIGMTGFADLPYNISPPTLDHAWLLRHLDELKPGMIGNATGIAGPIASCTSRLQNSDSKRRVIVLFTDGANNVNARISPRQAAEVAKSMKITIYTVGIGSQRAYAIVDSMMGKRLQEVPADFDEKLLQDIAQISGGKYYHARDAKGMSEVMDEINRMEKTVIEQPKFIDYKELAPMLAVYALILLLLGFLCAHTTHFKLP